MKSTLIECVRAGGRVLLDHFGGPVRFKTKENQSSIVTEADLASEKIILELIQSSFPEHNTLAEESGWVDRGSTYTWIVDPLDGTSNFAAGLPWFGVMVALLEDSSPILGAMYLPTEDRLYVAERGGGATRNGDPIRLAAEANLPDMLCACPLDPHADDALLRRQTDLLRRIAQTARNVRATNCLFDFVSVIEGRFGLCVNHQTMIWDIAAPRLIVEEAGGSFTDLAGKEIRFVLDRESTRRSYAVIVAHRALLKPALELVAECGLV
jgi:myo-inositol-1(or 4)-monophosphatase